MSGLLKRRFCIVGLGLFGRRLCHVPEGALCCRVTAVDIGTKRPFAGRKSTASSTRGGRRARGAAFRGGRGGAGALPRRHGGVGARACVEHLRPGTLLTDVCGVKGAVVGPVQALLPPGVEFIACHPMAGRAWRANADPAIFRGANFLITPTGANTPGAVAFARGLAQALGFARISVLSCEEHDKVIGYVSQLTHAIAVSLMNANADKPPCGLHGRFLSGPHPHCQHQRDAGGSELFSSPTKAP